MAKREWDVPKRDLLDIERTNQAESVEAADTLADLVESLLLDCVPGWALVRRRFTVR